MKIIKLTISNFMKLGAVEIEPCGGVVRITGQNGQGKSSVLNAIWAALESQRRKHRPARRCPNERR